MSETIDLAVLTVITNILSTVSLPLDSAAATVIGLLVFIPALGFFLLILRARFLTARDRLKSRTQSVETEAGKEPKSPSSPVDRDDTQSPKLNATQLEMADLAIGDVNAEQPAQAPEFADVVVGHKRSKSKTKKPKSASIGSKPKAHDADETAADEPQTHEEA